MKLNQITLFVGGAVLLSLVIFLLLTRQELVNTTLESGSEKTNQAETASQENFVTEDTSLETSSLALKEVPDFSPGPIDDTLEYVTYSNESGITFVYPVGFEVTGVGELGNEYQVLAQVLNPQETVVSDSDSPRTRFLVARLQDSECTGEIVNLHGRLVRDSNWGDDGFYGEVMSSRSVCWETNKGVLLVSALSAPNEKAQRVMNTILASITYSE